MKESGHNSSPSPALTPAGCARTQWALEGVGWRVEQHDRSRIELKLQYAVPPERRDGRYRADLFFFVPPNLGINPRHYDRDDFYEDLQSYTRDSAPAIPLDGLANFETPSHPLRSLLIWMKAGRQTGGQYDPDALAHAIKLYGATLVESMDEERKFLGDQFSIAAADGEPRLSPEENARRATRFLADIERNLVAMRELRDELIGPTLDARITTALSAVDEYLSLEVEAACFKLIEMFDSRSVDTTELGGRAREMIRSELDYRAGHALPSHVSPEADDSTNEAYQYRRGVLKKFTASALFLNLQWSRARHRLTDLIAAIAAGLAMAFALVIAVVSTEFTGWGMNSMPWLLVAIIAYIFKDRIKEWVRLSGARQLSRWLSDHRSVLREEGARHSVGTVCETHCYVSEDLLERSIREIRTSDPFSRFEREHTPERVMCYTREVRLKRGRAESPLTDILRYDFDRYTKQMDDPREPVSVLAQDGHIDTVLTPRIYRVYLVLRITDESSGADSVTHAFVRVILTSKGIRRVELAG